MRKCNLSFLLALLFVLWLTSSGQAETYSCRGTVRTDDGGVYTWEMSEEWQGDEFISYHSSHDFSNYNALTSDRPATALGYVINGHFEVRETDWTTTVEGRGSISIGGQVYDLQVQITEDEEDYSGFIRLNGNEIPVDENLGELAEIILTSPAEPYFHYSGNIECSVDGNGIVQVVVDKSLDFSRCYGAMKPNMFEQCWAKDSVRFNYSSFVVNAEEMGLGQVTLNGWWAYTQEMRLFENDPICNFVPVTHLEGDFTATVFGTPYHVTFDMLYDGNWMSIIDNTHQCQNFSRNLNLTINGSQVPPEQVPDLMRIILGVIGAEISLMD